MQFPKRSITTKVVAGYIIIAVLAGLAVWFIYRQVVDYSEIAQENTENNRQLILVSEITADLNKSENTSRRLIQSGNDADLELYNQQIDSIQEKLEQLNSIYPDIGLQNETDSIQKLLEQKKENLKELDSIRGTEATTNYYSKAIRELKIVDESFKDYNYENRFRNLKPYQRDILIQWLEYSKEDNADQLTNQKLDSVVRSVKKVLAELEFANRQFLNKVNQKENELLTNDIVLNQRLRNILNDMELKERQNAMQRSRVFQEMVVKTSDIIIIGGAIIAIIILFFVFNIISDITRSQRYRVQLEDAKNLAESLLASREQFMAAITHDLRSPLTTVMGYTDLIHKTDLNEKQKHYLKQIKKSSEYILRLVNDLLDLSKLEAGKMLVENLPFNPKKLILDTVNNIIPAEKNKDVDVHIQVDPHTNVQVESDPFRIKQILANLISNAWKFTEEGSITISADLQESNRNGHVLVFRIKDTGIGISKAMQESIFEEFNQENSSIEKKFGGSGLGLAITKRLTELLDGKIELNSEPQKGSEFIIYLPVIKISDARIEEIEKQEEPELKEEDIPAVSNMKALVVDDEPGQMSLTVELCKNMGFDVKTAENGKKALQQLSEHEFDIVLTDIQMPIMDGFTLIQNIRNSENFYHIPVIALSGRREVKTETYLEAGFDQNMLKPFEPVKLKKCIADVLDLQFEEESATHASALEHLKTEDFDLSDIYEFSGGDEDALDAIVKAFLEGANSSLTELEIAFKNNDSDETGRIAHRMLPMLRQMKAKKVLPVLIDLEDRKEISNSRFQEFRKDILDLMNKLESKPTV